MKPHVVAAVPSLVAAVATAAAAAFIGWSDPSAVDLSRVPSAILFGLIIGAAGAAIARDTGDVPRSPGAKLYARSPLLAGVLAAIGMLAIQAAVIWMYSDGAARDSRWLFGGLAGATAVLTATVVAALAMRHLLSRRGSRS